jgi:putative thioredoxin
VSLSPSHTTIDVTDSTFAEVVLAGSSARPVVVDFWAPWCGPCRTLGPVIEREVAALGGRVVLAKLNTDENGATASRYDISSIPAVKAFRDGKVTSEFVGARDARFVRAWLEALAPSPARAALAAAIGAGDEAALRHLVADATVAGEARLALARLVVARGDGAAAEPLLAALDDEQAAPLRRRLAFHADAAAYGGEERARATVAAHPADLDARWALASGLAARGAHDEALRELVEIVGRSRRYRDDGRARRCSPSSTSWARPASSPATSAASS